MRGSYPPATASSRSLLLIAASRRHSYPAFRWQTQWLGTTASVVAKLSKSQDLVKQVGDTPVIAFVSRLGTLHGQGRVRFLSLSIPFLLSFDVLQVVSIVRVI